MPLLADIIVDNYMAGNMVYIVVYNVLPFEELIIFGQVVDILISFFMPGQINGIFNTSLT